MSKILRFFLLLLLFFQLTFNEKQIYFSIASVKNENINPNINTFNKITPEASKYIWPTDASYKITSSFAEFRSSHFHAGIDISTNNKEGYNIYSSRDGYVYRIKILPDGYGKTLIVKHPDGYYTLYAHLKGFNRKIQEILSKEQLNRQSYFVDIKLDSFLIPVKSGEIIAYSGGTGVGPPHLHFEILDENFNPVNPLFFPNFKILDRTAPLIKKIYIAPAGEYSTVMGNDDYYFIKVNSSYYKINKPIKINGLIRLGVEAKDFNQGFPSKTGVYKLQLLLNDSLIFQTQYDKIPVKFTNEILLHYDLKLLQEGRGKFKKLYVEEGTNLPIYNNLPWGSGIIDCSKLKNGLHKFNIIVSDYNGNKSEITGHLEINNQNEQKFSLIKNRNLKQLSVSLDYVIFKNKLKCSLKTNPELFNQLDIFLLEEDKKFPINFKNTAENIYIGYIEPNPKHNGNREILVVDKLTNKIIKSSGKFFIYPIKKGLSNKLILANEKIIISFDEDAAYENFILTIDSSITNGAVIYEFNPKDILLKNGIDIEIKYNSKYENIYFRKNGKWVYRRSTSDKNTGYLKTKFYRTLSDVALLADTTPPSVYILKNKKSKLNRQISFKFSDNLSGVDYDKIKMYINNEIVIPEVDEEKKTINYTFEKMPIRTPIIIDLEIADKAGNFKKITHKL